MRRSRAATVDMEEAPEYWVTYSDLMVSLLMVFALLLLITIGKVQSEVRRGAELVDANKAALQDAAEALQGTGTRVTLDSATGVLRMDAEVLFDFRSAALRPEARSIVDQIGARFIPALLSQPSIDTMLQEIVIEGHTDTVGRYVTNLDLSQRRAFAVMEAILAVTDSLPVANRVKGLIVAGGRSEAVPIMVNGAVDSDKSRRIEVHVRFRNDLILKRIIESMSRGSSQ